MPTYEYRCKGCKISNEVVQDMSDPDPVCLRCGKKMDRVINASGAFILKGDCWTRDGWQDTKRAEKKRKGVL